MLLPGVTRRAIDIKALRAIGCCMAPTIKSATFTHIRYLFIVYHVHTYFSLIKPNEEIIVSIADVACIC